MGPDQGNEDRDARRRELRRDEARRKQVRRRRAVAAGVGVAGLVVALVAVSPWSGDDPESEKKTAARSQPKSEAEELRGPTSSLAEQEAAVDEVLSYTEYVREGQPLKPEVALTFDDGPGPYTDEIMRILRKTDTPATFFALGGMQEGFPGVTRKQLRQGHAVGSHSYGHQHMGQLSISGQLAEFRAFDEAFDSQRLERPRLFRPPYGAFNEQTMDLLANRGQLMVLWSVDTGDYENPGWDVIAERALDGAKPGAIILMHDAGGDRAQTVVALPKIIRGLERKGLTPVTVPQLLIDDPPPRDQSLAEATAVVPPGEGLPANPLTP